MKLSGNATLNADPSRVWDAVRDPAVLVRAIPGCERLETVGEDAYKMTVTAGVASIKGTYNGEVALVDPDPPNSVVLRAKGAGGPGTVDATVRIRLSPADGGVTRVDYDADAVVGGMVAGVGQRMMTTVARKNASDFFAAVNRILANPEELQAAPGSNGQSAVEGESPAGAAASQSGVFTRPAAPASAGAGQRELAAAFAAGGLLALLGVLVGWLIARR